MLDQGNLIVMLFTPKILTKSNSSLIIDPRILCDLYCTIDAPVIKLQYTRYAIKLHLSARAPLTNVEAVAANVNWKKNFDWRYFGILIPRLDSHYLFEIN